MIRSFSGALCAACVLFTVGCFSPVDEQLDGGALGGGSQGGGAQGGGSQGGGSQGGGSGGGGAQGGGGGGGACDGCRLPSGVCIPQFATTFDNCGAGGEACMKCAAGQVCRAGFCSGTTGGGGGSFGGGAGGGAGGGTFGGGAGGGAFGGGAGGGAFGGGAGGGFGGGGGSFCDGCRLPTGTCVPLSATSVINCGAGGSICVACGAGQICSGGLCMAPTRKRVGDACAGNGECQASLGSTAICKQRTSSGNASYLGGYCTLPCASTATQCPVGSTCVSVVATYGEADSICWDNCSSGDPCRNPGYACYGIGNLNACWIAPLPPIGGGAGGGGAPVGGGGGGGGGGFPTGGGGFPTGGGAGGGPIGGGAGGGTPVCDGCFYSGFCIPRANSNNNSFCGQGGVACQTCAANQVCLNYQCQRVPVGGGGGPIGGGGGAFDGGGFGGGTGGGFPVGGGFGGGIGGGGGSISCSAATCSGCCTNNFCVPPQSQNNLACGLNGNQCATCLNGLTCSAGACSVVDGGVSQVGNACTSDLQCRPPTNGFCIFETVFGQPTGWPGGACSASCNTVACPVGSSCLDVGGNTGPVCFQSCPAPRLGQSTCRTGYVCEVNVQVTGGGICIPRCNTVGFTCWEGTRCDTTSGYCIGP